jgi:hypothetical protein
LRSDGSEGAVELGSNLWDGALKEPSVLVDEVGEAVVVDGSVDLLDDHSLNEVASGEEGHAFGMEAMSFGDLRRHGVGEIWEHWERWSIKGTPGETRW